MLKVRLIFTMATAVLYLLICAGGANAAIVKTDLIGGLGEFEFSADTTWQMATNSGWPTGVKPATPDDSIAAGWSRLTGYGVVPEQDTIYRIAPGSGINGTNCQYFAIRNVGNEQKNICLRMWLPVIDAKSFAIHHKDQLTFRLDRVFMSGYTLPKGAWVRYRISILSEAGYDAGVDLTPSGTPFAAAVIATVGPRAQGVMLQVDITVRGDIGSAMPGIYLDGARLYRKSPTKSSYDTEQVPVPRNRAINTQMVFFQSYVHDPCEIAKDFDAAMLTYEYDYAWALRLKYYNPSIKVYLYEAGGEVTDWRDQNRIDPPYSNCPFSFNTVLARGRDWLYPWPAGYRRVADNRAPQLRDVDCVTAPNYPRNYYAHVDNSDYQQQWAAATADKVKRYRLDGVFVDGPGPIESTAGAPVSRTVAEVQSFEHGVFSYLHQAGLQVLMNCCIGIVGQSPANTYFDPNWKTDSTYSPSLGYENNTPETTPDTFFQEWAFFKHWPVNGVDMNRYDVYYWDATLANLEAVATWNKSLPAGSKKSAFALTHGVDLRSDPALGLDGWVHFALCSFMLAQNQDTWFGAGLVNSAANPLDLDLSSTVRLGVAAGNRSLLASDKSLQMRLYQNGLVIVNGHPTAAKTYRLPRKAIDENGAVVAAGKTITLKPHTGRMYFYK